MAVELATVFGGTGFLGRHIVEALAQAGWRVRVAARQPHPGAPAGIRPDVLEPFRADLLDAASVADAVSGASAVVNAVGLYVERGAQTFRAVHVDGAARLAGEAADAGARLVHVSGIGADRDSPSAYVRARAQGEDATRDNAPQCVILRPSVLFGADDALLATLERMTRLLPVVPLFGTGGTRLQPVYAGDVALAAVAALARPEAAGRVFELGGPRSYSYRELIETLLGHLGRRRLLVPVPFAVWELQAACLALLPNPPLTRDQITLMRRDNLVGEGVGTLHDLGVTPSALEDLLPRCLAS